MSVNLIHGDCLKVMPKLPAGSVQMVFADLPYSCTQNAWDLPIDLDSFWKIVSQVISPCAPVIATCTQPFTTILAKSNIKNLRYDLVWQKTNITGFFLAKRAPLRNHETMLLFAPKLGTYNPQKTAVTSENVFRPKTIYGTRSRSKNYGGSGTQPHRHDDGTRFPRSVLKVRSECRQNSLHPTQKPIALLEWLIKTYTNFGDTILDPCAGSGTTAIAALRTGRNAICIEKDQGYYDIMCKRVAAEQEQMRLAV